VYLFVLAGLFRYVGTQGESFTGRLFVLDKADPTLDDLILTEIVGGVIAARLDAYYLTEQLRQTSATEERIWLARDLHDGMLQSFTGIALRLAAIRRLTDSDRAAAISAVEDAQRMLASEQRDLRFFIQELKPAAAPPEGATLEARLDELAQRMERELNVILPPRRRGLTRRSASRWPMTTRSCSTVSNNSSDWSPMSPSRRGAAMPTRRSARYALNLQTCSCSTC